MANALVQYLTVACTGTGQATFYNTKGDQESALALVHNGLLWEDRRRYALSAALPLTDRSKQLVLENLLATGAETTDPALEAHILRFVVEMLPFNRVLNLFATLRQKKVNNARTRRLGRLLWEQFADDYRVIKYRDKFRTLLRHCHIPEGDDPARAELHQWIFGKITRPQNVQHHPRLRSRLLAKKEYACVFDLPFDIARDIAINSHSKTVEQFTKEFAGRQSNLAQDDPQTKGTITRKESLRARKVTQDAAVDFRKFSVFELVMHAYRVPADRPGVRAALDERARPLAGQLSLPAQVAVVVDNSVSALGSAERRFQPLAMIASVWEVLKVAPSADVSMHYVGPEPEDGFLKAEGATDLRRPLVEALLRRPELVILLSDGYENVRAGSVAQILATKAVQASRIRFLHLNPVTARETLTQADPLSFLAGAADQSAVGGEVFGRGNAGVRQLGESVPTFGLSDVDQLPMITLLGQAAADVRLLDPVFDRLETALKEGDYRAARLATRMRRLPASVGG